MKSNISWICRAALTLIVFAGVTMVIRVAMAQHPTVKFQDGHASPLSVKIVYRDGRSRNALLLGTDYNSLVGQYNSHQIAAVGDGQSKVSVWLDTIQLVKGITDKELTIVSKDGMERDFGIAGMGNLLIANSDDSKEILKIADCQKIEFLKPIRKDKKDKAMFDQWKYSPFTGERPPE